MTRSIDHIEPLPLGIASRAGLKTPDVTPSPKGELDVRREVQDPDRQAAFLGYNRLDPKATKAIAALVSRANGDEPDLTRHPWALLGVWGLSAPAPQTPAPEGAIVILEWQPVR